MKMHRRNPQSPEVYVHPQLSPYAGFLTSYAAYHSTYVSICKFGCSFLESSQIPKGWAPGQLAGQL